MTRRRPRILFAWEHGANFGHVSKISLIAERLVGRCELFLALREPWQLRQIAPDLEATLLPTPFAPTRPLQRGELPAANFAGMLLTEGWDNAQILEGLLEAWRGLFDLIAPDLLVSQAAPTALAAGFGLDLNTVVLGSGYDNPPLAEPMPLFDPSRIDDMALARKQEARVLACANAALTGRRQAPAERFCDLIRPDLSLLSTWPENDHYPERARVQPDHPPYRGPLRSLTAGARYQWAGSPGSRIFAYLRPGTAPAAAGLKALGALGREHDIICAAPGIRAGEADHLRQHGLQVEDGPIVLQNLLPDCDLGISHGSTGVAAAFLEFGVPQIALPNHREQALCARAIARRRLGLSIEGGYGPEAVLKCILDAIANTDLCERVRRAAAGIGERGTRETEAVLADELLAFLNRAGG